MTRDAADPIVVRLGRVLMWGNLVSTVMLVIGAVLFLAVSISIGMAFFRAGLVTLLATPIARVLVAIGGFASTGDYRWVGMSTIVLLVLIGSVVVALSH
jgi:uncharacterized membrane protein